MIFDIETLEVLLEEDDIALFLEPRSTFDAAIVGIAQQAGGVRVVAYDIGKCVIAVMNAQGWERDEAMEWLEHNTFNAYVGEGSPIFIEPLMDLTGLDDDDDDDDDDDVGQVLQVTLQ